MKTCGRCKIEKPVDAFSKFARATDGRQRWCKACFSEHTKAQYEADPERFRQRARAHYASIPPSERGPKNRRANLRAKYSLTPEAFDAMLERQGGRCAVCRTADPGGRHGQWHTDHDHSCCPGQRSCGKCLRGLLCGGCNTGIGQFGDDPERLMAAATYLLGFKDVLRVPA